MNEHQIASIIDAAEIWYDSNQQCYHTWDHATRVMNAIDRMFEGEPVPVSLRIAAAWHDVVYIPGATSDANERCSAAALVNDCIRQFGKVTEEVKTASELICFTSIDYHLHDNQLRGEIAYLLDADLCRLASDYIDFALAQDAIIQERLGNIETDRKQCADFLAMFLTCRKFIYHTEYARLHWEKAARRNIEHYIKTYGSKVWRT